MEDKRRLGLNRQEASVSCRYMKRDPSPSSICLLKSIKEKKKRKGEDEADGREMDPRFRQWNQRNWCARRVLILLPARLVHKTR